MSPSTSSPIQVPVGIPRGCECLDLHFWSGLEWEGPEYQNTLRGEPKDRGVGPSSKCRTTEFRRRVPLKPLECLDQGPGPGPPEEHEISLRDPREVFVPRTQTWILLV